VPEGHSLHRLADQLGELVGHAVAATSPQGRVDAGRVDGGRVSDVQAFGKHLLLTMEPVTGPSLDVHVHLGMRGKWLRFAPVTGPGLKQVRLRLARPVGPAPELAWDLIAPSTCELLDGSQRATLLAGLGPDPLRPDGDREEAHRRVQRYPGTIGAALMDQAVLAGVGNVFRAEILHACRIAPDRPAARVGEAEFAELWERLQAMMRQGVTDGRIITVDVPEGSDRLAVAEDQSRRVYKQAVCYDCGTPVATATVQGRTSYSCPHCQPD
jgi:formamidopyrimidine-DNA glycosylase